MLSHHEQIQEARGGLRIAPLADRPGLSLSGEVDLTTRATLEAALESLAGHRGDVHLDLAGLDFVDVGGAALLMRAAGRSPSDRRLVLHHVPPQLRRIIGLLWDQEAAIDMGTA